MKCHICILSIFVILMTPAFFLSEAFAINSCSAEENTTVIYFVNGVWNSRNNARKSMNLIQKAYKQSLEDSYPGEKFEFKYAYNYSAGKVRDIIELIGQKMNELDDLEVNNFTKEQYLRFYLNVKNFSEIVPDGATPLFIVIEEYLAGRVTDLRDTSSHIQMYRTDLQEGRRVLLIPHSQGNMFAYKAILALMDEYGDSIGMIGVASPSAVIHNNSTYYTAHDDRVINKLREDYEVLPSNIDNDPGVFNDYRGFSNHSFKNAYFVEGLASRAKIDEDIVINMENLQFPYAELGSGAITITLTWGIQPDVDLHVVEPNGAHVYYGHMQGLSGYLDLDDVDSYGPEHYYVACDSIEVGQYHVGVNYYYGSGAETAQIQISTADGNTRTFSKFLPNALGSSGDDSPIPVANIVVTQDEFGKYYYSVEGVVD